MDVMDLMLRVGVIWGLSSIGGCFLWTGLVRMVQGGK